MSTYQIWSAGYAATGQSAGTYYHGEAEGSTFQEACQRFANNNPAFARYFDAIQMTYWGCHLSPEQREFLM